MIAEQAIAEIEIDELNAMDPESLLAWAATTHGAQAALVTSFQLTGGVMIDMASRVAPSLRVATIDTLRLHPETYALIKRFESRYGIDIERFKPDPDRLAKMIAQHGEYLFFDNQTKQEYCCEIRKVEPNRRVLETLDVWITGLRRDQSGARQEVPQASVISQGDRTILKLCPLVHWSEEDVWAYTRDHEVPYNKLYDKDYKTIGCFICSTPNLQGEEKRAGRWRWFNQISEDGHKECGIHSAGGGI